jgi:glycosyltransferase involved in cell wall biosynthesis
MKILMVLEREFPHDTRVENEIESLVNTGHQIHLACYTLEGRKANDQYKAIQIYRKKISRFLYKASVGALKFPYYFNFWRTYINQLLANQSFDAIHIHDLPLIKVGLEIKERYNIHVIVDLHENWPAALREAVHTKTLLGRILSSDKQWVNYEKNMLTLAERIITVVDEMKERLVNIGVNEDRIIVIPNTLQIKRFNASEKKPDKNYITLFYAGGLNIHRGLQIVIRALPMILDKYSNSRLWIIGSGTYIKELKQLANHLKVNEFITFFGWKNLTEINDLLSMSDIALIPHLKSEQSDNSSPNKLFQYMYAQKPILASNCNSIRRIIEETDTGVVYLHDSPDDFALKLMKLLKDSNLINMGVNGKKTVMSKYNWDITVKPLVNLYNSL